MVSYPLPADGLSHYILSVSEGHQIERRPNKFTMPWAQIIVKFRVGSMVKIFHI